MMNTTGSLAIQAVAVLALAPLLGGIIGKVKAFVQKRKGAPVLQQYFDLVKLFRKGTVVSDTASWIFRATPWIVFSSTLAAALLVPVSTRLSAAAFAGDAIAMVSLLALGRFFLMLSALDTAGTFGGMGASREAMVSALIEPSILVSLLTVGLIGGTTSVSGMMWAMAGAAGFPMARPALVLVFAAFLIIILAESCRLPFDDPSTHLELTMIHEAMVLEYSGRDLALMEYAASVKQLVLIALAGNLLLPHDGLVTAGGLAGLALSLALFAGKTILLAALVGAIESATVKVRLFSVPNLASLAFILSFFGFLLHFILGGGYV